MPLILQVEQNTTVMKINPHKPGQLKKKSALQTDNLSLNTNVNFCRVTGLAHNLVNNQKTHKIYFQKKRQTALFLQHKYYGHAAYHF